MSLFLWERNLDNIASSCIIISSSVRLASFAEANVKNFLIAVSDFWIFLKFSLTFENWLEVLAAKSAVDWPNKNEKTDLFVLSAVAEKIDMAWFMAW